MTSKEKAAVYRENVSCCECINHNICSAQTRNNPNLVRIFGSRCEKLLTESFENGDIENTIAGIEQGIDKGLELSEQEVYILSGYYRAFNK